ncbi:hypothetical protein [Helicobacter sp. T3_23-1056]
MDCHDSSLFDKSLESRNDKNAISFNDKNNRLPRSFHSLAMTQTHKKPTPFNPPPQGRGKFGNSANGGGQKAKYFAN